jgi:hypothetical protein
MPRVSILDHDSTNLPARALDNIATQLKDNGKKRVRADLIGDVSIVAENTSLRTTF